MARRRSAAAREVGRDEQSQPKTLNNSKEIPMKAIQSKEANEPDLCRPMPQEQPKNDSSNMQFEGGFLFCPQCGVPIAGDRQTSEFCPCCNTRRCVSCGE
jgi:rubrerythrin